MLATLTEHPLLIGLLLSLAAALVLIVAAWLVGREARPEGEVADPLAALGTLASRQGRTLAAVFGRAIDGLKRRVPGRDAVYAAPWVLLLGQAGSGKSALAAAVELERPLDVGESAEATDECALHVFETGVLLDPRGGLLFGAGDDPDGDLGPGWRRLVAELLRRRPARALDGVVLTVPCSSLIGPDRLDGAGLAVLSRTLRRRLRDLQQQLGLRLPVYVVVTRCDDLAGFGSFWRIVGERRSELGAEMLGWSNPSTLDTAYAPHLVGEAFDELGRRLHRILIQSAVTSGNLSDVAFVYPAQLQKLANPLRRLLDRVFQADAFQDAHFLRGLYFTGVAGLGRPGELPAPPQPAPEVAPAPAGVAALPAPAAAAGDVPPVAAAAAGIRPLARPDFVTELFAAKIFAESAVARAARRGLVVRSRAVRSAQAALAATVLILSVGLWFSARALGREDEALMRPLSQLEVWISAVRKGGGDAQRPGVAKDFDLQDVTARLLKEYRQVDRKALLHLFLPSSWFSPVEENTKQALAEGFRFLVLDAMRVRLRARWEEIDADAAEAPARDEQDWERLGNYLEAMGDLSQQVADFNRLGGLSAADFIGLVRDVVQIDLSGTALTEPGLYEGLIASLEPRPFDLGTMPQRARATLARLAAAAKSAVGQNAEAAPFRRLADALERASLARVGGADAAGDALQNLNAALGAIRQLFAEEEIDWLFAADPGSDPDWLALEGEVRGSLFFGPQSVDVLRTAVLSGIGELRTSLLALRVAGLGAVVTASPADGRLALVPDLVALADMLPVMLKTDALAARTLRQPVAPPGSGGTLLWVAEPLVGAMAQYATYEKLVAGDIAKLSDQIRPLITALVAQRVQGAMLSALADAQIVEQRGQNFRDLADEAALKREVGQFAKAAPRLGDLLTAFNRAGFDGAYGTLSGLLGQHLLAMLGQVEQVTAAGEPYLPVNGFRAWDGTLPLNFDGYEVLSDVELAQYLDSTRARLGWIASELAQPLVSFILAQPVAPSLRSNATVTKWQRVLIEQQRYQADNPRSTLAVLERFLRFDLAQVKPETCLDQLGTPVAGNDWFAQRQDAVRRLALQRCQSLAAGTMQSDYGRLAAEFNATLAGRYPFADPQGADTPEADPDVVGGFLARFTAAEPAIRRGLGKPKQGSAAAQALDFVSRMAAVRDFMAPFQAPTSGSPAGWDVEVEFRVNRSKESGGNQIIGWTLDLGGQSLSPSGDPPRARWTPAQPVALTLRWAKDAPVVPTAAAVGSGVTGADRSVSWSYEGRWSLLRLLQAQRAQPASLPRLMDANPHTLVASVKTAPAPVPGAGDDGTPALITPDTTVFIRVGLSTLNADGKTRAGYTLPAFPFAAPRLDAGS